ncbi:MAG: HlyD family secretion protein [Candidatus Omnitrophica bacterium]|nr:HlyD family secretion protein [Candidatus Omnitrophota bacterium]
MQRILKNFDSANRQKTIMTIIVVIIVTLLVFAGYHYLFPQESTDDAFTEGHVIMVSPKVSGHIAKVYVNDNQFVHEGDLLLEIDERDYAVSHDLAQAENFKAQAELKQAKEDLGRYHKLFATGDISKQELDKAILKADTAQANLDITKAHLKQAQLNLSYTKIKAMSSGHVTRKSVEPGDFVQPGSALLAVVMPERWVIANFKETQITRMHPGQKVVVRIDAYPQETYYGHIDSIQRATGARFSLLPAENATGNYVKVVQRVPVKIIIDSLKDADFLPLGLSVVPVVDLKEQ